jgi:hypothetical protein
MKKDVLSSLNQPKSRYVKFFLNFYNYNMFDVILVEKVAVRSVNETYNFLDTVKCKS